MVLASARSIGLRREVKSELAERAGADRGSSIGLRREVKSELQWSRA